MVNITMIICTEPKKKIYIYIYHGPVWSVVAPAVAPPASILHTYSSGIRNKQRKQLEEERLVEKTVVVSKMYKEPLNTESPDWPSRGI